MSSSNVITKEKFKNKGKSVLLFSGGMDSLIFDKLLNPDILLYIPSGSKYKEIESKKIKELWTLIEAPVATDTTKVDRLTIHCC